MTIHDAIRATKRLNAVEFNSADAGKIYADLEPEFDEIEDAMNYERCEIARVLTDQTPLSHQWFKTTLFKKSGDCYTLGKQLPGAGFPVSIIVQTNMWDVYIYTRSVYREPNPPTCGAICSLILAQYQLQQLDDKDV